MRRDHSRRRLKEDGSDDDQLELIGSTCALESTVGGLELRCGVSGFRRFPVAMSTRPKAIDFISVLLFYVTMKNQFNSIWRSAYVCESDVW